MSKTCSRDAAASVFGARAAGRDSTPWEAEVLGVIAAADELAQRFAALREQAPAGVAAGVVEALDSASTLTAFAAGAVGEVGDGPSSVPSSYSTTAGKSPRKGSA